MSQIHHEDAFQAEIAAYLADHGWLASSSSEGYDNERALWPEDLLGWLADTDPDNYAKIVPEGDAAAQAAGKKRILDRVARNLELSEDQGGGTLNVLRRGVHVPGARQFKLMQPPVATDLNPEATARYAKNRLRVVRELRYSARNQNRIDLVLFLNGIPVATIETKTEFSQPLENVKLQYRRDRRPTSEPLLTPFRGALVHFGLSEDNVVMTTELKGAETSFLPFDRGHNNGAGNPQHPSGHRTAYLWEEILARDTWLNIIAKFIYVNHRKSKDPLTGKTETSRQLRFPRYHQWRAVTRLVEAASAEGAGHKYLIQHSAGSGKTDSIAWTAHRLADLQRPDGTKVFDSVIVISDRQVLDKQLQDAVDQLSNVSGKFQAINTGSEGSKTTQLMEAFAAGVPIIGLTLQTFPFALRKMQEEGGVLAGKRFAVIADEAHSSQSGAAANALKELLYLDKAPGADPDDDAGLDQDALNVMAARADDDQRISYFAFTATPKAKTLEIFGRRPAPGAEPEPFHLYSMKQAIEEGFILDVLQNYTSYEVAARITHRGADGTEQEVDARRATRAILGKVELHPTNIHSKVHEIINHFNEVVRHELGGRAKAMVVTSSRAAAVQYHRAFQRVVAERGLDLNCLVAFSGEVEDPDVPTIGGADRPVVTEASSNHNPLNQDLADLFRQRDQHVLIVANKYQTGFDEPLLVGMYVDKKLSGISAVQTLSRLNRTTRGKRRTYVLDFIPDNAERVEAAFKEYYEDAALVQASDPDLVADLLTKLENAQIFTRSEVNQLWVIWRTPGKAQQGHAGINRALAPAIDRFGARWQQAVLAQEDEELSRLKEFRETLAHYTKYYDFFSQIQNYGDEYYEKLSVYAELLHRRLSSYTEDDPDPGFVDVDEVVLTHYKLQKLREESISPAGGGEGLRGITEAGISRGAETKQAALEEIIEKVNQYLGGLDVDDEYKLSGAKHVLDEVVKDERLKAPAFNNAKPDFKFSKTVRVAVEDALWSVEDSTNAVLKRIRELPAEEQVSLLLELGLYERLRGEGEAA